MRRRQVIQGIVSAPAMLAMPAAAATHTPQLPEDSLFTRDPEKYWARIREQQFLLPGWRAFLNNGSLGVAPKPVVETVRAYLEKSAALLMAETEYPRWGYEKLDEHRAEAADYLGCDKNQLAFTHNATEALSTIAAGLDLKSGDEVVMTDQEHASGKAGWQVRRARHGIDVREVPIPLPPRDPDQLADIMVSAIGPRTRVLFFSAITTTTGLLFPVRRICDAARAKGVITVVDGAHLNGQVAARIDDLGCDFYAGSPHKWMFAPAGCGILWGRPEMLERLWPSIVTGGWDNKDDHAARFMKVGTNNRAIFEGMLAGVRFAKSIGVERIYARSHHLARLARQKVLAVPGAELFTPDDDRMYGALLSFRLRDLKFPRLSELCRKKRIWITGGERIRLSTHIHTRPQDLDLFFETVAEARKA